MPAVGTKQFPYTRDGIDAAKAESRATGQKIKARQSYADVARATADRQRAAKKGAPQPQAVAGGGAAATTSPTKPLGGAVASTKKPSYGVSMVQPPEGSPAEEAAETPAEEKRETGMPKPVSNLPGAVAGKRDPSKSLGGSGVTIQDAIKHPGALTAKAKAAGQSIQEFAAAHQHDGDETGSQARFYLNVLKKANK